MSRMRHIAFLLVTLAALAAATPAHASPDAVIKDCAEDGDLDRDYSNRDLRRAEDGLPSDLDEYSDCREVIAAAISAGPGGKRGAGKRGDAGGAGAGDPAALAEDQAVLDRIASGGGKRPRLRVGGETLTPGDDGLFEVASASNGLPLPLLLVLVALGLLTATGGTLALRRRVPALARIRLPTVPLSRVRLPRLHR